MADKTTWEKLLQTRAEWAQSQPSLGAQMQAMAREAARDIRSTVHESFFGKPEHASEMGAPGSPTPQMVTQQLGTVYGSYESMLDAYASRGAEQQHQQEVQR